MADLAHRLFLRLTDDDASLTATAAVRCIVARAVFDRTRNHGLLAFRAAGPVLRVLVAGDSTASGELARRIQLAVGRRLGRRFLPVRVDVMHEQWQLQRGFFGLLQQRVEQDTFHEASSLPDLLRTADGRGTKPRKETVQCSAPGGPAAPPVRWGGLGLGRRPWLLRAVPIRHILVGAGRRRAEQPARRCPIPKRPAGARGPARAHMRIVPSAAGRTACRPNAQTTRSALLGSARRLPAAVVVACVKHIPYIHTGQRRRSALVVG